MTINENTENYKRRTRIGFSTNAKGKAQLDITVELLDGDNNTIKMMLDEAIKSAKEVVISNGFTLAD
jgi:ribosome-interacting GTPase 1